MKLKIKSKLLLGLGMVMTASSAMGAFTFNNGDLILGFQATGGTGNTDNVFFNLGAGTNYRDGITTGVVGNIGNTLSSVYGANWYNRSDLYFGIIGNLNSQPTSGIGSRTPVNGDPSRTFYLSTATSTVGEGSLIAAGTYSSASLGTAGTTFSGMETMVATLNNEADGSAILNQTANPTGWNNSWTVRNPTPGAAFGIFTGGIQQNFGKLTDYTYVDLQRVLATNTGANPTGTVGGGEYMTTFGIADDGSIAVIPEPSTAMLGGLGLLALFRRNRPRNTTTKLSTI